MPRDLELETAVGASFSAGGGLDIHGSPILVDLATQCEHVAHIQVPVLRTTHPTERLEPRRGQCSVLDKLRAHDTTHASTLPCLRLSMSPDGHGDLKCHAAAVWGHA